MKIEGFNFDLPLTAEDIPLWKYQKYATLLTKEQVKVDDDYLKSKIIQIFCGITHEQVMSLEAVAIDGIVNHLVNLLDFPDTMPLERKFTMVVEGEEIEFGFEPNLDKLAFGAFIDLNKYIDDIDKMNNAMAVLYRPIKKKWKDTYSIRNYKGSEIYATILKDMPTPVAISSRVFFYRLGKKLPMFTVDCLLSKAKEALTPKQKLILEQNGDGIHLFTLSLKAHHLKLRKQLGFQYTQL